MGYWQFFYYLMNSKSQKKLFMQIFISLSLLLTNLFYVYYFTQFPPPQKKFQGYQTYMMQKFQATPLLKVLKYTIW